MMEVLILEMDCTMITTSIMDITCTQQLWLAKQSHLS